MPRWRVDIPSLHLAIETVQRYRRMSAREVADEIGVPPSTMTRLKDGQRLDLDAFASVVAWLRADPSRFIVRSDGSPSEENGGKVLVNRRDALMAWSWASEALSGLPEKLQPPPDVRRSIEAALQRLCEDVGHIQDEVRPPR